MEKLTESQQLEVAVAALKQIHEKGCRNCGSYSVYNIAEQTLKQLQQLPVEKSASNNL